MPVDRSVEVEVPEVTLCLSEDRLEELYQRLPFDPLDDDGNYGIEHYLFLLDFVATDSSFLQN